MQKIKPINDREQDVFISHASKDKSRAVDALKSWLVDTCGLRVWYDRDMLAGGDFFSNELADAITKCRSMIIVVSEASVKSAWVGQEVNFAMNQQAQFRDFTIIPVLLDNVQPPGFLQNLNYISMPNGELTLDFCDALLSAFYPRDMSLRYGTNRDIYASVSWHPEEAKFTTPVCQLIAQSNFRLVGDTKDQRSFLNNDPHRVENIIASCGGLLAVLPYRETAADTGFTSPYMLAEIAFAQQYGLPYIVIAETKVILPETVTKGAMRVVQVPATPDVVTNPAVLDAIEAIDQAWKSPVRPQYVFYSTSFDNQTNIQAARKLIQAVTSMRCFIGEEIESNDQISIQQAIINRIKGAFLVIGDITRDEDTILSLTKTIYETSIQANQPIDGQAIKKLTDALAINSLIEVGAARGANVQYRLMASAPRRSPPFMVADIRDVLYYTSPAEMLGIVHKFAYPFRRRIMNYELSSQ